MRGHWIVSILSTLVCMGLLLIIMGQYQVLNILTEGDEKQKSDLESLENEQKNQDFFKATLEKLLAQGGKVVEDLEATVAKLSTEKETKTKENDACQAEKKTKADELPGTEKEHRETDAKFKAELDTWNQEISTLKAELTVFRPICKYVKKDPLAQKVCGNNTNSST